ncbi:MAG: type I glyceraldehyde-3-phosphate dehydrogenase [Candidatus Helarchaeota archaeon]|nr:type I glyceraldehyde-3-phosphate dehydrogenase [Candidatus Helarchaeota archaeon]
MTNIAVNGFGRIGRNFTKALIDKKSSLNLVAINDLFSPKQLAHLLKYDSVFGVLDADVSATDDAIILNGKTIKVSAIRNPAELPWSKLNVDFALESTGLFRAREKAKLHLDAGAKKVVISAPAGDADVTLVLGVNDAALKPDMKIISNASCTTNCLAPVAKVLNDSFGIENGLMTTIHAYTGDQRLVDTPHKDMRRARHAALNMIPTTTGAAKAVGLVLPDLAGKLNGIAVRVPTPNGSLVDLVVNLKKGTNVDEINGAMKSAANGPLKGILQYNELPLVSTDIIGNPYSSIFDSGMTQMISDTCAKVLSWYDNEFGYSNRLVDLMERL